MRLTPALLLIGLMILMHAGHLCAEDQPAPVEKEHPKEIAKEPAAMSEKDVPEGKRTTVGLYATSKEAYARQQAAPDTVKILDVRTPEEFVFVGHAPMAVHVPLMLVSYQGEGTERKMGMKANDAFEAQVKKHLKPADTIYIMCRSGGRSAKAVDLLAKAGFTKVYTVVDGFEGDSGKDGKRDLNGWKNSGLPWTYDVAPGQLDLPAKE